MQVARPNLLRQVNEINAALVKPKTKEDQQL